jgi:hypothetical protein
MNMFMCQPIIKCKIKNGGEGITLRGKELQELRIHRT